MRLKRACLTMRLCSRLVLGSHLGLAAVAMTLPWSPSATAQTQSHPGEWPTYAGDLASTKYSPLALIDQNNVRSCESPRPG